MIDVPGREDDLARLTAGYARVARGAGGQTLYVTGAPGSGRTALLRAFAGELARRDDPPTLITGAFENGRFVSWDDSGPPPERVTAVVEKVVSLPEALVPYAALVGLAMSRGEAAIALVRELFGQSGRIAPTEFLPRLMEALCGEGPVVLLVDDADRAPGGLWGDAVLELAERVARDRPLLFVLAIERPAQLDGHEDDEPESLYLARRLRGRGRARWVTLDAVALEALAEWTGPAAPDVLERLLDTTGGRAAWAGDLWRHWQAGGVVVPAPGSEDDPAPWTFAEGGRERTLDAYDDVLGRRLAGLAGEERARVRALLAHAALEGPVFTADAAARALQRDRDEVIDLLDDMLLHDDEHPDGVVHEAGSIDVEDAQGGARHLWLYRFDAELDWLTLAHRGLEEAQRRAAARTLAQALVEVYGGPHYVADTLARLYELAGDEPAARRQRRLAEAGANHAVLLWRAEALLARPDPQDRPDRRRAAEVLLGAARGLSSSGPHDDGLRYAQAAYRLAPLREDRAEALHLAGVHEFKLGEYDAAHHALNLALALHRESADEKGQADARAALALIDSRRGAHEQARSELAFVLDVYHALGERDAEAATRQSLANVDIALGAIDDARANLTALMALEQEDGDRRGEAGTRLRIARLDTEQERFDGARGQLNAALDIYRELGDRHGEADARHNLARLGIELGSLDDARREFMRILAVYRELGDLVGQAATRHSLASIAMEQGVYEKARRELTHVLELGREMGDEEVVQTALEGLEVVNTVDPPPLDD
ncbi:MAG: tetratricopeptide repeat protein [Solirubrobacteraceae bacterium]|nr:tetratricopeptide repeat protein [Solirubrobacteraceae bacterium]